MNTSPLICKINRKELDDEVRTAVDEIVLRVGMRCTVYLGLVTRSLHVVLHDGRRPRKSTISGIAASEFEAMLPTATSTLQ